MSEAFLLVDFEEYLGFEQLGDERHELVGGRVYAMSGRTERHDLVAGLLYETVAPVARRESCRAFIGNRLLRVGANTRYYPDLMVVCGSAANRLYETDPTLVVEVLSRSTAALDRREKAVAYASSKALRAYVVVDPDQRRFEVAVPTDEGLKWQAYGPGSVVVVAYLTVVIDDFYDAIDAIATT